MCPEEVEIFIYEGVAKCKTHQAEGFYVTGDWGEQISSTKSLQLCT